MDLYIIAINDNMIKIILRCYQSNPFLHKPFYILMHHANILILDIHYIILIKLAS